MPELLEIVESRCKAGSIIFCTQYGSAKWYDRMNPNPNKDYPISDAIIDCIIHNSYELLIKERFSMHERPGLKLPQKRFLILTDLELELMIANETIWEAEEL